MLCFVCIVAGQVSAKQALQEIVILPALRPEVGGQAQREVFPSPSLLCQAQITFIILVSFLERTKKSVQIVVVADAKYLQAFLHLQFS